MLSVLFTAAAEVVCIGVDEVVAGHEEVMYVFVIVGDWEDVESVMCLEVGEELFESIVMFGDND